MRKEFVQINTLFIACFLFSSAVFGQNKAMGQSDPNAKKVLDQLSANFKKYKAVKASFVFKNEDAKGKVLGTKKGNLYMKGAKYRITLVGGQDIFCDGINIWTYDNATNEVTISKFNPPISGLCKRVAVKRVWNKSHALKLDSGKH
jgi:outer membrane lipoprotein-sorting protein